MTSVINQEEELNLSSSTFNLQKPNKFYPPKRLSQMIVLFAEEKEAVNNILKQCKDIINENKKVKL